MYEMEMVQDITEKIMGDGEIILTLPTTCYTNCTRIPNLVGTRL